MLIVLSGLPGTGKTTIARLLARRLQAVHLRIDTIEQALLRVDPKFVTGPEGYVVAHGIAADNLRLGLTVVADAVNAARTTRASWESVARECGSEILHVHLECSDVQEHERRVLDRVSDIAGHVLPKWDGIARFQIEPALSGALALDTYALTAAQAVDLIAGRIE